MLPSPAAAARDDQRLHRSRLPDSRHQRATPAPGARELFPDILADLPLGAFLCFLFFVLEAVYMPRAAVLTRPRRGHFSPAMIAVRPWMRPEFTSIRGQFS
jgi:hypothetical protein